jgi:hypothetical protein
VFDLHVHAAPCVVPRRADDTDTALAYERAGFSGCVLKSHCESTVGRAVAAGRGRTVDVFGGLALNATVGGFNAVAVAASLSMGARVIWLPTVDARAHHDSGLVHPPSCAPSLPRGPGFAAPPVDPTSAPALRTIFSLVAEADAVLATGHLGGDEVAWVVREARAAGVRRILLTHPSFTVPSLSIAATLELTEQGAFAEVTAYQWLHQDGMTVEALATFVRALGPARCILSSDAGQPGSPEGPAALLGLIEVLAAAGVDRRALEAMSGENPAGLVCP